MGCVRGVENVTLLLLKKLSALLYDLLSLTTNIGEIQNVIFHDTACTLVLYITKLSSKKLDVQSAVAVQARGSAGELLAGCGTTANESLTNTVRSSVIPVSLLNPLCFI